MSCLGGSGPGSIQFGHVGADLRRFLPARGLQALQLLRHALKGEGGGAGARPYDVAVEVVAVVVGVEDVLHRFGGDAAEVGHGGAGAAGEVGVHHDEVILHLDDGVVAVAEVGEISLAEPDAGRDEAHDFGVGVGTRDEQGQTAEHGKGGKEQGAQAKHGWPPWNTLHPMRSGRKTQSRARCGG